MKCEQCHRNAVYGLVYKQALHCHTHRLHGEVNVMATRCEHQGCTTQATFGPRFSNIRKYCSVHKEFNHFKVNGRKCQHLDEQGERCLVQPTFGSPNDGIVRFCNQHKRSGDLNLLIKVRCEVPDCYTIPVFGSHDDGIRRHCATHKFPSDVNLSSKYCQFVYKGIQCITQASFGSMDDGVRRFCGRHRRPSDTSLVVKKKLLIPNHSDEVHQYHPGMGIGASELSSPYIAANQADPVIKVRSRSRATAKSSAASSIIEPSTLEGLPVKLSKAPTITLRDLVSDPVVDPDRGAADYLHPDHLFTGELSASIRLNIDQVSRSTDTELTADYSSTTSNSPGDRAWTAHSDLTSSSSSLVIQPQDPADQVWRWSSQVSWTPGEQL